MVFFNHATRQMTVKIVYYGPGLCGKTTNLNTIYGRTSQKARGEMVSLNTETDRTLFFDLLPMDVGTVGGFKAKLQLYTVPGQVFYNSTRKLVLKGVDGIVFVADSQVAMFEANRESLQNLEDNLRELGMDLREIPMVFQWNKRDLRNVVPLEQMEQELNLRRAPSFQSIAQEGQGVFETLRGITRLSLAHIVSHHLGDAPDPRPVAAAAPSAETVRLQEPPPAPEGSLSVQDLGSAEAWDQTTPSMPIPPVVAPSPRVSVPPVVEAAPAAAVHPPAPAPLPVAPAAIPAIKAAPKPEFVLPALKKPALPAPPKAIAPGAPKLKAPTAPALPGAPASLKLALPAGFDGDVLDIRIEVRASGVLLGELDVHKAAPAPGSTLKLNLDLRRS